MTWTVEWDERARKELRRLDQSHQREIIRYLKQRIEGLKDPTIFGKSLMANKAGLWHYRVGNYRLVCTFEYDKLIVLILSVGHRKDIYL